MELRPYQRAAVNAAFDWCAQYEGHPLLVLPTGSGKSLTLGTIAAEAIEHAPETRVLVLAHRKELIEQNVRAVATAMPFGRIGVFSAGLNRKDTEHPVLVAGVQSFGRDPYAAGAFDLALVDEAHLVPPDDTTLYRKTIQALRIQNPRVRFVGLTATPYRMGAGLLHRGPAALFTDIAYEAGVKELVDAGYLCRLISKATATRLRTEGVHTRGGEFIASELAAAVDVDELTAAVVAETLDLCHDRHKILVFCAGVAHAEHVAAAFQAAGAPAAAVHAELGAEARAARLRDFRDGRLRVVTNVDVLTVGYDEPAISALVMLRPTKSVGLYVQMAGRGFRLHPSKQDTLVLDFAGNVARHGPVDAIRVDEKRAAAAGDGEAPSKECPTCNSIVFAGARACPDCAYEFPPPERPPILPTASTAPIMSDELVEPEWEDVTRADYSRHAPRAEGKLPTLRVDYYAHFRRVASEWVCVEHTGYARAKAEAWWARRSSEPAPRTVDEAVECAPLLLAPTAIATKPDGKYTRIVDYRLPDVPRRGVAGLPRACWSCDHWRGPIAIPDDLDAMDHATAAAVATAAGRCGKWDAEPPADVRAQGCPDWTDESLPF